MTIAATDHRQRGHCRRREQNSSSHTHLPDMFFDMPWSAPCSGTPYSRNRLSICGFRFPITVFNRSRKSRRPRRTPMEISNPSGIEFTFCGETGLIVSGMEARFAKYPAIGPHAMATSISPLLHRFD